MATQFVDGLAVEVEGDGSPVVCVHGLGGTSNTWTPLLSALHGHRVVRVDLPGSGRSPFGSAEPSIERMADAVLRVCIALEIEQAVFVGHSMGTIVCQQLALRQPRLVSRLALFGPLAAPADAARPNIRARASKAREGGVAAMQEIADAIAQGGTSAATRQGLPLATALVRESLMRQEPEGYARSCEALADVEGAPLESIACPVLLVTGEDDAVAPPAAVREMASRLADAEVVVLPQCGHWTPFEKPGECTQLLAGFLQV